uniref:Uncharacterized protein n=1 Tax=Oryza punctata TaxID=4537 RepID=A0A0E0LRP7_ORYPU
MGPVLLLCPGRICISDGGSHELFPECSVSACFLPAGGSVSPRRAELYDRMMRDLDELAAEHLHVAQFSRYLNTYIIVM